jgi:hypothetical protein
MRSASVLVAVVALAVAAHADAATKTPLAGLVVPRSGLGPAAAGFQVALISGEISNARAANESYDPRATPASVTNAGRLSGYRLIYGDPGYEALRRGAGLLDLGTSLDYFKSAKLAWAYERKWIHDLRLARGENLQGVVVERIATFRVGGLGPQAIGLLIRERFGSKRVYNTYVDFQIGDLLCESAIRRADPVSAKPQAVAIARVLANRIARYARGELKPVAVPLPRPLGTSRPGRGAPDLRSMVLRGQDLKAPSVVVAEGFAPDDEAIASYFRQFRFGAGTGLLLLRSSAALERSRREAAGRMLILRSLLTGPGSAATLASLIVPGAKRQTLDGVRRGLGVGEESFSTTASFTAGGRRLRAVLVQVRRDRVIGSLVVVGQPRSKGLAAGRVGGYAKALDAAIKRTLSEKGKLVA